MFGTWSANKTKVENIEDFGFARGYTYALDYWKEILDGLNALRNERGMMVVLIAHAKIERFENPETDAYDRDRPRLNKHASALVQEWSDEVLGDLQGPYEADRRGVRQNANLVGSARVIAFCEPPSDRPTWRRTA